MGRARKLALWIGGGTAVFVGIVAVAVFVLFRDSATPVTRDAATFGLDTVVSGTEIGDPGLYVYETTGFETASALGGSRHDYPVESYLAVRPEGCGTVYRWQVLEERWGEDEVCDDGRLAGTLSYHKWFGVEDLSDYPCGEGARLFPAGDETSWSFVCENTGVTTVTWRYEVIGPETIEVGGEPVETLHIVATETDEGTTVGFGTYHRWVLTDPYLLVREVAELANTTETAVGGVDYVEQYEIVLTSLTPSS